MANAKITERIDAVGVLNPALRVFDIVMRTEYGTSYNAYLVRGSEKTALIETVHHDYLDVLHENLKQAGAERIDYIILNHTEPDHSGALAKLLDRYPGAEIICSKAASIYLKNIANKEMAVYAVKDGEELSLGDRSLRFLSAPFLHWPDSMFTYCPEENVLFTCDFLGAHYCEPQVFSDRMKHRAKYQSAFLEYYAAIFGPFREYVLKGLDKIADLSPAFVCPSHGPVLVGEDIETAKAQYRSLSLPKVREDKIVSVFYASAYGCTRTLAEQIRAGILSVLSNAQADLYDMTEYSVEALAAKLEQSDGFLLGSPTINKNAVPPVWDLLARADAIHAPQKAAAAFGSYGWSGEAVPALTNRLREMKFKVPSDGLKVCFVPTKADEEEAFRFGSAFAAGLKEQ